MFSSLDSLTKNLVRGGKKLFGFEDYSEIQYDLLTRKGVYPYEYVNSWDRFNETQLSPIDVFHSNLNMSSISEEDYQHAQRVWKEFGEARRLYDMFPELPMGPLTKKQWKKYKRSTKCHICYKLFTQTNLKVRDHCHYTGLYGGPAHSLCNLRYKIPSYIPVMFHNLSGYDAHLFIRELGAHTSEMGVIAKNKEDYISFSIKVPVDSYIDKNGEEKDKLIELRFIVLNSCSLVWIL